MLGSERSMQKRRRSKSYWCCAGRYVYSMLEEKIRKPLDALSRNGIESRDSSSMGRWDFEQDCLDVILVAPQVRFTKRNIIKRAEPYGVIVQDIDTIAYGMVDGEKIFAQVLEALQA